MMLPAGRGPFAGWPADAVARVDRAAERHGGWARFAALTSVKMELLALGGPLPRMMGLGRTFTMPARMTVWPHECRVQFGGWERSPTTWRSRSSSRTRSFLDADGASLRVRFADDWPAHNRVQRFWLADDGLLVRHDYVAEIVGRWAQGAHFVDDYVEVAGVWIPRRRRVRVRVGRQALPIPVLHAQFGAVEAGVALSDQ